MASRILLKHGTVLLHDERDVVHAAKLDLLIEDSRIKEIGPDIESPADAKVVDCMDKIISPGFIDTHHHVWQTCLKATHANETLLDYFWSGNVIPIPLDSFHDRRFFLTETVHQAILSTLF